MNLFTVGKIPMYCEGITHRIERRKDRDVKVVDLALRIEPFSSQLAAALDQDEYGFIKRTLFKMSDGDPTIDLRGVEFRPPSDRQKLYCFASPDSPEASICLDQVKVTKLRARSAKAATGWVFYVNVSFGPVDKSELAFVNEFYTNTQFIRWEAAEPSLDFSDTEEPDEEDREAQRPTPMWDDDGTETHASADTVIEGTAAKEESPARVVPMRGAKKTKGDKPKPHTSARRTH